MKQWLLLLSSSLLLVGCAAKKPLITINGVKVMVEVMDTDEKRQQGLSGREQLGENEGMLFVFDQPGKYGFWMKEMKFPLDMVWIKDNKVVEVTQAVPAPKEGEQPVSIKPKEAINKVLEVNSGWVEKHKIKAGDEVK